MKKKHNEGFSLVETLVAIVLLSIMVIPTCSGMVMAYRMNAKTDEMMHAQLAVSSAVETLMAEGITGESNFEYDIVKKTENGETVTTDRFPDVKVQTTKSEDGLTYTVTVVDNDGMVEVTTTIRKGGGSQ